MTVAPARDMTPYLFYLCDDNAPDGERFIGFVYGTENAKEKLRQAMEDGLCVIVRPYEAMVRT